MIIQGAYARVRLSFEVAWPRLRVYQVMIIQGAYARVEVAWPSLRVFIKL